MHSLGGRQAHAALLARSHNKNGDLLNTNTNSERDAQREACCGSVECGAQREACCGSVERGAQPTARVSTNRRFTTNAAEVCVEHIKPLHAASVVFLCVSCFTARCEWPALPVFGVVQLPFDSTS